MCQAIAPVVGSRISDVRQPPSRLHPIQIVPRLERFRPQVAGRTIAAVRRVGKRVVLELCGDKLRESAYVVIEPRMTGLVLLADPPDRLHLRLVFHLAGGKARRLLFWDSRGLGVVRLVAAGDFPRLYGPERLGPDALEVSPETLRQRLYASRRPIKVALLDQRALAGVGNLYASEVLHRAAIHPATPCRQLRPRQWQRLHAALGEVLADAIRHQGSTLRDGTYRVNRDQPGGYQDRHQVYQRSGQTCPRCGKSQIVRIVQAQRSTFFCPRCQRAQ